MATHAVRKSDTSAPGTPGTALVVRGEAASRTPPRPSAAVLSQVFAQYDDRATRALTRDTRRTAAGAAYGARSDGHALGGRVDLKV